jgi:muramoyltetrapeptide carboxypeptidase
VTEPIRPRALRPGDAVALVAPASPVRPDRLADGIPLLRSWGLDVRVMPSTESSRGYLAGGSDQANAAELTACFADPSVAGILCVGGGYGSMRLLPHIDWDVVRANPKVFCGYSDITALHQAIRREAGFVTFHGPMVARQSSEDALHPWTAERWHAALFGSAPLGEVASPPDGPVVSTLVPGRARGRLVGGNLTLVSILAGSRWQLDARGCILLLEDTNEFPRRLDRMLSQLHLSGILDGVAGVVFGDSPDCDIQGDPRTLTMREVFEDRLGSLGVPFIYGFPCGHTPFRATLPLGALAELDADRGTLTLLEPGCSAG